MPIARPLMTGDPHRLGGYELVGRLGEGGQGVVYLGARDDERYAVKLVHGPVGEEEDAFLREVELAKHVARFCTAQVIDVGFAEDGRPYIVSEYVDGPSLHREVALTGPKRGASLERLAVGCATALAAIHRAGIVHRDFKPQNVLLGPDGPRVIDFGLARALDAAATQSGRGVGTPAYMAPEQITASAVTGAADVFAWGATMCYAANGWAPFGQDSVAPVLHRILTAPPELGRLDGQLGVLVRACLDKDPRNRPASRDLLLELLGGSDGVPAEVLRSPPPHILRAEAFSPVPPPRTAEPYPEVEEPRRAELESGAPPIAQPETTGLSSGGYRLPEEATGLATGGHRLPEETSEGRKAGPASRAGLAASAALLVSTAVLVAVLVPSLRSREVQPQAAAPAATAVSSMPALPLPRPQVESEVSAEGRTAAPLHTAGPRPTPSATTPQAALVTVPSVVGMDRAGAVKALKRAGLAAGEVAEVDSPRKIGRVLSATPAPGTSVARGTWVALTVSNGVVVPPLTGLSRKAAESALTGAGLKVGGVRSTCTAQAGGTVLSSDPAGGTRVAGGTPVSLVVARKGASVPSVVGQQRAQARAQLRAAGFAVRVRPQLVSDAGQAGVVLAQSVAAGTCAASGAAVVITVGVMAQTGPEPTEPTPTPTSEPSATATG
ncbi:protein kinase domain-containing protein [Thermoactinospora rubra]|uniref:protein kinase domain-containing protein n=1 Tax=Thermoactinospora rubra TaxID=1088767 RepID=UPI0011815498|nr:PASTA domain-containing protein [Thermoactinospora rubra]